MSDLGTMEPQEEAEVKTSEENNQENESVIDLLNRDEVINTLMQIAEALSTQKKSACYALDGKWGIGKTFVLDRLEEQLKKVSTAPDSVDSRYLIFRYNCWEYDYYEEPLLAIISVLLDQLETYASKFTAEAKGRIIQTLKKVGKAFVKIGVNWVASRIGVDSEEVIGAVQEGLTEKINDKSFDQYINFKKNLNDLRNELKNMSSDYTIIFIVDELDRCLPEYSIRVLERLHHLMEGLPNTQMLLAVDAEQLEHTVRQIFGQRANVSKYLSKFIQFKVLLSEGDPIEYQQYETCFQDYRKMFADETQLFDLDNPIPDFIIDVFKGIEIRNRILLVEKCQLIHSIYFSGKHVFDPIYLCLELMLATIQYSGVESYRSYCKPDSYLRVRSFSDHEPKLLAGVMEIIDEKKANGYGHFEYPEKGQTEYIRGDSFWGWLALLDYSIFLDQSRPVHVLYEADEYADFETYAKQFWTCLNSIV